MNVRPALALSSAVAVAASLLAGGVAVANADSTGALQPRIQQADDSAPTATASPTPSASATATPTPTATASPSPSPSSSDAPVEDVDVVIIDDQADSSPSPSPSPTFTPSGSLSCNPPYSVNTPIECLVTSNGVWALEVDGRRGLPQQQGTPAGDVFPPSGGWTPGTHKVKLLVGKDKSNLAEVKSVDVGAPAPTIDSCGIQLTGPASTIASDTYVQQKVSVDWTASGMLPDPNDGYVLTWINATTGPSQMTISTGRHAEITIDRPAGNANYTNKISLKVKGGNTVVCGSPVIPAPPAPTWRRVDGNGNFDPNGKFDPAVNFSPPNSANASLATLAPFTQTSSGVTVEYSTDGSTWSSDKASLGTWGCGETKKVWVKATANVSAAPTPATQTVDITHTCSATNVTVNVKDIDVYLGDVYVTGPVGSPGASADLEFVYQGSVLSTTPLDLSGTPVFQQKSFPATAAGCTDEVRVTNPSAGVTITARPVTGLPITGTDCDARVAALAPGGSSGSGGSSTSSTPGSGTSGGAGSSATGSSTTSTPSSPATTGGGGASSASAGASRTPTSGGSGAAPNVRVFTSKCLSDSGLYSDMAGSIGSSFVMAPNLRSSELPTSFAVTSGSLPTGIRLDAAAGVVYGVPTQTDSGAKPITITATNADGTTTASTFSFPVDDPHHSVSYPVRVIAGLNEPVDVFHHGKGNSGPTSYSLVCGTMPDGLRLDPKTGVISGTPTIQVQYPVPLRIRQVDDHGWVDSSMMLLVDGTANPWLTYPDHVTVAKGTTRTIRPTVVGLPDATYELIGKLPRGMQLNPSTGAITGKPTAVSKKPAEVSVLAVLPDGTVAASDTLLITVRKRAIPMAVKAAKASTELKAGKSTTVITKVKHTSASKLKAKVVCTDCTHTFNKETGKVTVRPGAKTTTVKVTITANPVGKANRAKYRHHVWSRTWNVR